MLQLFPFFSQMPQFSTSYSLISLDSFSHSEHTSPSSELVIKYQLLKGKNYSDLHKQKKYNRKHKVVNIIASIIINTKILHKYLLYIIIISVLCPVLHFKISEAQGELKECPHIIRILEKNLYEEYLCFSI